MEYVYSVIKDKLEVKMFYKPQWDTYLICLYVNSKPTSDPCVTKYKSQAFEKAWTLIDTYKGG